MIFDLNPKQCDCMLHSFFSRKNVNPIDRSRLRHLRSPFQWVFVIALFVFSFTYLAFFTVLNSLPGFFSSAASLVWDTNNIETVDTSGPTAGDGMSMAFDASSNPVICYYDSTDGDLNYATRSNLSGASDCAGDSDWSCEVVDTVAVVTGRNCSIAWDTAGSKPVISYYDLTNTALKFASRGSEDGTISACSDSDWNCETVHTTGLVGQYSSIAVNPSSGQRAIAYFNETDNAAMFARRVGSGGGAVCDDNDWTCEDIKDGGLLTAYGEYVDLLFEADGTAHVAFLDSSGVASGKLGYAIRDGSVAAGDCATNWFCETVDSSAAIIGSHTSMALDSAGLPNIIYYNDTNVRMHYAKRRADAATSKTPGGGNCSDADWDCEGVNSIADGGRYNDVYIDGSNTVFISHNQSVGGFAFTSGTSGNWTTDLVVNLGGSNTSIGLDSSGQLAISYSGGANDIRYIPRTESGASNERSLSADQSALVVNQLNLSNIITDDIVSVPSANNLPPSLTKLTDNFQPKFTLALDAIAKQSALVDKVELLRATVSKDGTAHYQPIATYRDFRSRDIIDRLINNGEKYFYKIKVSDKFGNFKISEAVVQRSVPCAFMRVTDINNYPVISQYRLTSTSCSKDNIGDFLTDIFSDMGESRTVIENKISDSVDALPIQDSKVLSNDQASIILQKFLASGRLTNLVSGKFAQPTQEVDLDSLYARIEKVLQKKNEEALLEVRNMVENRLDVKSQTIFQSSSFTDLYQESDFVDDVLNQVDGNTKFHISGLDIVDHPVVRVATGESIHLGGITLPRSDVYIKLKKEGKDGTDWIKTTADILGKWDIDVNSSQLKLGMYQIVGYTESALKKEPTPQVDFGYVIVASSEKAQDAVEEKVDEVIDENLDVIENFEGISDKIAQLKTEGDVLSLLNDGFSKWDQSTINELLDRLKQIQSADVMNDIVALLATLPNGDELLSQIQDLISSGFTLSDILSKIKSNAVCIKAKTCTWKDIFPHLGGGLISLPTIRDVESVSPDEECAKYDSKGALAQLKLPSDVEGTGQLKQNIRCFLAVEPLRKEFWKTSSVKGIKNLEVIPTQFVLISKGKYSPTASKEFGTDRSEGAKDSGRLRGKIDFVIDVKAWLETGIPEELRKNYSFTDQGLDSASDTAASLEEIQSLLTILLAKQTGTLDDLTSVSDFSSIVGELTDEAPLSSLFSSQATQIFITNRPIVFWWNEKEWIPWKFARYDRRNQKMYVTTDQLGVYGIALPKVQ